ncbi:heme ABC exporter ATP-binding protein CcmA [Azospirillum sp. ST 5-10]|uniref:heme ABC exporter ATP-binding protein CcmA n=1 Tax=unclassified Azospirillum TaxID=2630922 RepID=UPI003F4A032A
MPVFAGTDLTCLRGDRLVFTGLDFRVGPGEALVLLGPNGSGKSSLLRIMAGLLRPFRGRLAWDEAALADDPDRHRGRAHYVGHLDAVKPVLTAVENLAFWAALGGADAPASRAREALERLGVPHIAAVPGRYLSAGQKRRLNLARILAAPAPLWLLDEPTVALDRAAVGLLEGLIAEHRAAGGMVVVSTHADIALPGAGTLHLDDFAPAGPDDGDGDGDDGVDGEEGAP